MAYPLRCFAYPWGYAYPRLGTTELDRFKRKRSTIFFVKCSRFFVTIEITIGYFRAGGGEQNLLKLMPAVILADYMKKSGKNLLLNFFGTYFILTVINFYQCSPLRVSQPNLTYVS